MKRFFFQFTIFIFFVVLLFSCNNHKQPNTHANSNSYDSTALHIALVPNRDCMPIYYAKRMGIYDSLGVNVQIISYYSQMDCDTALMGNRIDGGWADNVRLKYYNSRMPKLDVMWKGSQQWNLLCCGTLRINNVKSLKGRTIAIARFSAERNWLESVIKQNGLNTEAYYFPQINDFKLRAQMLTGDQIDAAVLSWPYTSLAYADGHKCIVSQKTFDGNGCFVMKHKKLSIAQCKKQWLLFEKGRKMALDSIRIKGAQAYSLVLQKDYGIPKQIADTIKY